MNYYRVHCTSLDGETEITIDHLAAPSDESAMEIAETFYPVRAQSAEVFKCSDT